jgi:hypothetical protein
VTALAEVSYDILRGRTSLDDPRITYAELAELVRDAGEEFECVHHRNRQLYVSVPLLPPDVSLGHAAAFAPHNASLHRCRVQPGQSAFPGWLPGLDAATASVGVGKDNPY